MSQPKAKASIFAICDIDFEKSRSLGHVLCQKSKYNYIMNT